MPTTPLPFTSTGYQVAYSAAILAWAVPEWVGSLLQRVRGAARREDHGSYAVVLGTIALGFGLSFFLAGAVPGATIFWHRRAFFVAGIVLALLGVALRWYAIWCLGRYFTRVVAVRPNQQVVRRGPYRFVRHPAYSGMLLTILGLGLALTNWASLLALVGCAVAGLLYRIRVEERALRAALGRPYEEYMRHTRRLIPFVY
ncbi:MAG TPA: isoprenylcysteine carboxylmethyltransferase family protein [Thermomicrobiales bacterium]|nr:isoprenylcysteine carboxylmethyltransferase family protein [Thermomicrobiales bacterium]